MCTSCGGQAITYVVAALSREHDVVTHRYYENNTRILPNLRVLRAVNGHNSTEVIEALLASGLSFHRLSSDNKRWGKLATWLTKWKALRHQVRTGSAYQITLEEDVVVHESFCTLVSQACEAYLKRPELSILHLSGYAEVLFTSLNGARGLLARMQALGIWRADDQTLGDARVLRREETDHKRISGHDLPTRPYHLARATNSGDIIATRKMSWTEMNLLRLLTSPGARQLPNFGNPDGVDAITESLNEKCAVSECKPRNVFARGASPWWSEIPRLSSSWQEQPAATQQGKPGGGHAAAVGSTEQQQQAPPSVGTGVLSLVDGPAPSLAVVEAAAPGSQSPPARRGRGRGGRGSHGGHHPNMHPKSQRERPPGV